MRIVFLIGWSSQSGSRVAKFESALEAKELDLQTLPGLTTENATLRTEENRI